ncbi:TRPM8 channel-associated factor homolog isoform X1 [Perca fluviatilis]|nr:TRPM8 channel-associated factor homolog isoform X1 [Perca fluviatilis]
MIEYLLDCLSGKLSDNTNRKTTRLSALIHLTMSNQPIQNKNEGAYMSVMRGLRELDLRGPCVPSDLVLIGDHAFPLAMNSRGQVLMAASLYGRGRIVVLGHEGYLTAFPALVENALTWLRGDGSDNLSVGVHENIKAVADKISKSSFQANVVGAFSDNLGVGVYVTDAYSLGADVKDLVAFLKAGGGVLIAGQAWNWAANHPTENTLLQFEGNKVSGVAGIYFSKRYGEVECLPVYPQIPSSWMARVIGKDFEDDLEFLLEGVSEFDLQGGAVPSELLVHGPLAFPIGTTGDGRAFLAGAYYGQGRVIVVTHEGFLGHETLAPFWKNAIHWLDEGRQGVVGIAPNHALEVLRKSGLQCEKTDFRKDLSVFVCTAYSDHHAEEIRDFVAEGGGLLIGGHAWYWAQTHPGQNELTDFPGNKILNTMGLSLLRATIGGGIYKAPVPSQAIKDAYHFRHLLHRFAGHVTQGEELTEQEEKFLTKLGQDCVNYLQLKAHDCSSYTQVVSTLTDIVMKSDMPQVCESSPVKSPKDHLLLSVAAHVYKICPDPDALLPSLIKDNPLMPVVYNHKIQIDANTAGREEWISTGLYLSPGMKTYISIPAEIVNKGWKIQIGCQTDHLQSEVLKRAPCVHERFPIISEMMQVWNLWGGLIYLVAPLNTQVEGLKVTVQMAVPAPYYKSGVTTAADWLLLRTAPSPWAELEFDNIILTVPSDVVRSLDRPDQLAAHWDEIMRGIADLASIPHKFPRKERFVTDVQISHGWMHAGYPIMTHKSTAAELVSIEHARSEGLWGPIHELGHNQQRGCWEFPSHTTECTCNLWSVYVHEEVLGINRAQAHPCMTLENRNRRAEDYAKNGKKLSNWHMWVALETYMQLQDKFGWDAFKKVFAAYHKMSNFPSDNDGKMNLYAETFSQTVGMNLAGFFKAWGWPIQTVTEEKLSNLPPWTDHPMVQYD